MTKLEEVARAIFRAGDTDPESAPWEAMNDYERKHHMKLATAAVEALREPGKEILDAYNDIACEGFSPESSFNLTAFDAMLDAILDEKPE